MYVAGVLSIERAQCGDLITDKYRSIRAITSVENVRLVRIDIDPRFLADEEYSTGSDPRLTYSLLATAHQESWRRLDCFSANSACLTMAPD